MIFPDIISDIVDKVKAELALTEKTCYYLYGHPQEIFNILTLKSNSETFKYSKYPLIALYLDYESTVDNAIETVSGFTIVF